MAQRTWENEVHALTLEAQGEVKQVVAFINDRIVPEIRNASLRFCRGCAVMLRDAADALDGRRGVTRGTSR